MLTGSLFTIATLALASVASAKPIPAFKAPFAKRGRHPSFNSISSLPGLSGFDNFYGVDNFSGISQTIVHDKTVVCHTESIEIVQQYLTVIREYYKKIITEQVCEVETQTVLHEQFFSGCSSFLDDIRHISSREVTFDHSISSQIVSIHNSNGDCVTNDLGWNGNNIGSHSVVIQGSNWNDATSYNTCNQAYGQVQLSHDYCTSPSVVSTPPPPPPPSVVSSSCDSCDSSSSSCDSCDSSSSSCDSCDESSSVPPPPPSDSSCDSDDCEGSSSGSGSISLPSNSSDSSDAGLTLAPANSTDSSSSRKRGLKSRRARIVARK